MDNSDGPSLSPPSWEKRKASDDSTTSSKLTSFESEHFFSSSFSRSNDYCPYSIRQSQLSMDYQNDVLLVYDPEENSFYVDKLMEYLRPQNLKIFDFSRDAPPGLPQRKVLQSTLKVSRYTCIVITRKFLSSFWLQLRTDMSIQAMLDNEEKMYSVIVVVMDSSVKKSDLPLDLATLSPLFITEKFFENRIKLAFGKTQSFPSLQPSTSHHGKSSDLKYDSNPPKYDDVPTARFDSVPVSSPDAFSSINRGPITTSVHSMRTNSRLPIEHGDGTFVMPPSIFPNNSESEDSIWSMQRSISVRVSSTGLRQPQETIDSIVEISPHGSDLPICSSILHSVTDVKHSHGSDLPIGSSILHSVTDVKQFLPSDSSTENSTKSSNTDGSHTYKESDFSFLNRSPTAMSDTENDNHTSISTNANPTCQSPAFFSIRDPSFIETESCAYSDLEISDASQFNSSSIMSIPETIPIPNSMDPVTDSPRVSQISDNESYASLPADLNTAANSNFEKPKKSKSLRSIVSLKFASLSRTFSKRKGK